MLEPYDMPPPFKPPSPEPADEPPMTRINPNDRTNGMAITAFILGVTGFLFLPACIGLGLGLGALGTIDRTRQPGKGLAISAVILSSIWIALWLLFFIFA